MDIIAFSYRIYFSLKRDVAAISMSILIRDAKPFLSPLQPWMGWSPPRLVEDFSDDIAIARPKDEDGLSSSYCSDFDNTSYIILDKTQDLVEPQRVVRGGWPTLP